MTHKDDEWGNLGGFDANDLNSLSAATNRQRAKDKNSNWYKANAEANRKKAQDPNWIEANKIGQQKKDKDAYSKKMKDWWSSADSKEHRKKHVERTQQMGKRNAKPIQTPDGIFPSLTKSAEFYKITKASMTSRMKCHPDKYYYIETGKK